MQMRIIGYILIIVCPAACGWLMSMRVREELRRLEGIIELIRHIKYEICRRFCPQEEIFERFENTALTKCGFVEILKKSRVEGEKSALTSALDTYGKLFPADAACERAVRDFAESLGKVSFAVQSERCDFYILHLEHICSQKHARAGADIKLCRSMGALVGVVTALLLL